MKFKVVEPKKKENSYLINSVCVGEMLDNTQADEIRSKIPLNPLATEERIKQLKGDEDPMDCVFAVKYRFNNRGMEYLDSAYEDIVNKILKSDVFVPSSYGHQSPDAFSYEGRELMGSVIGAKLDIVNGVVYYRIIPDKGEHAKKIRRWLKNKQINAVSIWGIPTYEDARRQKVIHYNLRSVDFVPPLTEGQENLGVTIGEMNDIFNHELEEDLIKAVENKYSGYVYIRDFNNETIIARKENQLYKIPYKRVNGKIELGSAVKVRRIVKYEVEEEDENMDNITNYALLAEIKRRTSEGRMSAEKVAGEMGLTLEDKDKVAKLESVKKEFENLKVIAGEMSLSDAVEIAKKAKETEKLEAEKKAFGEMVSSLKEKKGLVKDGKSIGEMAILVDKFAKLELGMTEEQIAGEMDRVMNDPDIKRLVGSKTAQVATPNVGASASQEPEVIEY
ncbi:MAG: hypothetical protein CR988_02350 [Treponema sp.]|nr:MAG: hypothetical protein CR988_02350 [Treponema sp.]